MNNKKEYATNEIIEFYEKQKITKWVWLILLPIVVVAIGGSYKQLIMKEEFGDNPMSDSGIIVFLIFILLLVVFFLTLKLNTLISNAGIQIRLSFFIKKKVAWDEIKNISIVDYGFVGGWGIRCSTEYGTIYNMRGSKGLAVELKNGRRFLVGTQRESELSDIIKRKQLAKTSIT